MKIKTKKQLNLPQLIEWGFNNPELAKSKLYLTKEHDEYSPYVQFSVDGYGVRTSQSITNKDTFTVEVEGEITEDTEFRELVGLRADDSYWKYDNTCIYDFNLEIIKAIYIPNNDLTMTLIWRDGKLVE